MNFSEALHLVIAENEKITRKAWKGDNAFLQSIDAAPGSTLWVMKIHPSMFGLDPLGTRDRIAAFTDYAAHAAQDVPSLIRVISSGERGHGGNAYRHHHVDHWTPDMVDLVANDWEIASTWS